MTPGEMSTVNLTLGPKDDIYLGHDEDVKGYFSLYNYQNKSDLAKHQKADGKWKPGRLVIETKDSNYQVWVAYEKELQGPGVTAPWGKINDNSRIIHSGGETREKAPKPERVPDPMDPVIEKVSRYFGRYEFGVYKETEGPDGKGGAVWKVDQTEKTIPYLKAMNARGRHIFVRPAFEREAHFMLHDDLDKKGLDRTHKQDGKFKPGRMVVESSPGNYQVWIRSNRALSNGEKKHWLDKMGSDPGASPKHRWGRAPGFRNRKEKYEDNGRYPLARLVWVDWKGRAEVPKVELPKQEAEYQPRKVEDWQKHTKKGGNGGALPTRDMYYAGVDSKGKPKESEQDYRYALALMRRGVGRDEVESRIRSERSDWKNHKSEKSKRSYFKITLDNAQKTIDRTPSPRQSGRRDPGRRQEKTPEPEGQKQGFSQGMSL
jgi:hypothetical protein